MQVGDSTGTYYYPLSLNLLGGNVGIGTVSPLFKLDVGGTPANTNGSTVGFKASNDEPTLALFGSSANKALYLDFYYAGDYARIFAYDRGGSIAKNIVLQQYGGNVGIGTTSPGAKLTVDTTDQTAIFGRTQRTNGSAYGVDAEATGSNSGTNTAGYFAASGGATNYSIYIENGYPPVGASNWAIYSNSPAQSYIKGNVGIGTTNVDKALDVYKAGAGVSAIKIRADQNNYPNSGLNTLGTLQFGVDGAIVNAPVVADISAYQDSGNYGLRFRTYTSSLLDRMIIDKSGNVGIGTANPVGNLDVKISTNATAKMYMGTSSTGYDNGGEIHFVGAGGADLFYLMGGYTSSPANSGYIKFVTNYPTTGTEVMRIVGGNVGIGTAGPNLPLTVVGQNNNGTIAKFARPNSSEKALYLNTESLANFHIVSEGTLDLRTGYTGGDSGVPQNATLGLFINTSGNVGIGTVSPGEKVDIAGNIVISSDMAAGGLTGGNYINWKRSTDNWNPAKISAGFTSTGDYGGFIRFDTNTGATVSSISTAMIVNKGNVGIGTVSPGAKLQANNTIVYGFPTPGQTAGTLHLTASDANAVTNAITFGGPAGYINITEAGIYSRVAFGSGSYLHLATTDDFNAGAKVRMTIDQSGNVGIGTASPLNGLGWPSPGLEISGGRGTLSLTTTGTGGLATLRFKGPSVGSEMHFNFTDGTNPDMTVYSYAGGGYMFTLKGSGNVGIGTTGPAQKLHLVMPTGDSYIRVDAPDTSSWTGIGFFNSSGQRIGHIGYSGSTNGWPTAQQNTFFIGINSASTVPMIFRTNDTERMRIDSTGNVGIGTVSPNAPLTISNSVAVPSGSDGGSGRLISMYAGNNNHLMGIQSGGMWFTADDALHFYYKSGSTISEKVTMSMATGNVGIGTVGQMISYMLWELKKQLTKSVI